MAIESTASVRPRRRHLGAPLPAEGEDGLFSESWFPICLSSDVPAGKIVGADFLDGKVVCYRGDDGVARVMSAYCAHLGADLSVGAVVGDKLRCAFHHWTYNAEGVCDSTKVGDPPPPAACLFRFATRERHGIVWAYNGEHPRFELPAFPHPEEELMTKVMAIPDTVPTDPWVLSCNTPDMQHIKALHGVTFGQSDPHDLVRWTDHSMLYDFRAVHANGAPIEYTIGIFGNNIYYQSGTISGRWFGMITPFGLPRPGHTRVFAIFAVNRRDGDDASNREFLRYVTELEMKVVGEDIPVVNTIHFRPGTLTRSDRTLARFFDYLRAYPRCHPAAEFIR